jgi:Type IV secretion-system coupling protein DNA-binding domain
LFRTITMPEVILGRAMQTNQLIPISDVERRSGLYILGRMGRGKTSLMTKLLEQDMANGHGVFFLDPHGDAVEDLQTRIPSDRHNDVIVLDPSDKRFSFGLNPLACSDPDDMTKRSGTYAQAMALFQKLFANIQTEELDILLNQYLRNSFFPLIANQGSTLLEMPLCLEAKALRERLLAHPSVRPEVARFWHTKFDRLSPTDRDKETASTARRLDPFQDFDEIRHIVGQSSSTIDFFTIMQERKILLVKLKKTLPGDAWRIIGTLLISALVHAVREREQLAEDERHQFCIFVDEFQNFASSEDFAVLFTEARKYGIATTIAHQERYGQFADNKRIAGATDAAVINTISNKPFNIDSESIDSRVTASYHSNRLLMR